ncbi:MAG: hypothetical protein AAGC74_03965 [Verrucomicrobiota bacterium]
MPVLLKCAACGTSVPFEANDPDAEAICPSCEVLLRRRSIEDVMAIPVSMELPEQFEHADLQQMPKQSEVLVNRYQKNGHNHLTKVEDPGIESNLAIARAIERLALAIEGNRDSVTSDLLREGVKELGLEVSSKANGNGKNGHHADVISEPLPSPSVDSGMEKATVLFHEEEDYERGSETVLPNGTRLDERMGPLNSPVLVRREAAEDFANFRRNSQALTDEHAARKASPVAQWVERHPIFMLSCGLFLLLIFVVLTTVFMEDWMNPGENSEDGLVAVMQGEKWADEPDFRNAEREARGFLNAISLNAAKPYIFQAEKIEEQLELFYEPLPDPGSYELEFRGRRRDGERSVYFYQVTSSDQKSPLVVLQERDVFKVFWEFSAGVGEMTWDALLEIEPTESILMRAFIANDDVFGGAHPREEWSSWLVEDWDGANRVRAYTRIDSPADRRLKSAIRENAVQRKNEKWVMGQIMVRHLGLSIGDEDGAFDSVEITEVPLASWLPEEFESQNTFYSESERLKEGGTDRSGLQSSFQWFDSEFR